MHSILGALISGLLAGALGGLLGIGGGIVLIPFLRFYVGLSPSHAAGTCVLAAFCTTLSGSYRHYRLGHIDVRSIRPVIAAGVTATIVFSLLFLQVVRFERWLDLGTGLVFSLIAARMILEGICDPFVLPEHVLRTFSWTQPVAPRALSAFATHHDTRPGVRAIP